MLPTRTLALIPLALALTIPGGIAAQQARSPSASSRPASPLWGDLVGGPHQVGFQVMKLRDATRPYGEPASAAERGYPLVLSYWYPARPASGARPMTFHDYQVTGRIDDQLREPTAERIEAGDQDLKAFYERPFNFPFGAIEDSVWARLGPTPLTAFRDAAPVPGTFPLVVGVGGAGGNQALGEYLASHGYVVALIGSPANVELGPVARMEWYARDLEFALARMRELPGVDPGPVATWGFSFAGMPALLAAMRSSEIAAVVSLESAIFYPNFFPQLTGNPFYSPTALRVPFLHMIRTEESRPNENLAAFQALRYSSRLHYLLNDTALVHQDFGTHGMAAAVVLQKRSGALTAARLAQRANAEFVRNFLDAHVKRNERARAWLAQTPEHNGFPAGAITVNRLEPVAPAPSVREFTSWIEQQGIRPALDRFHAARRSDPEAPIFQENTINQIAYQLLRGSRPAEAIEIFRLNVELYPASANTYDSLSEAYEAQGDSANAVRYARRTLEVAPAESRLPEATRDNLVRISNERIQRLGGR
jgi:tetratricopeptide (TPR) repeat protein